VNALYYLFGTEVRKKPMNKLKCSECGKEVDIHKVKYHTTPDETPVHVFCDAYCSHDWHVKNKPRTGQYELAE
tara:strand:- start:468 stop:686 length:219 start_codon:yes stop_codon:yes gene_type:complete